MNSRGSHVGDVDLYVAEIVIDPRRPTADVAIAEIPGDARNSKQLHLIARSERIQVGLEAGQIDLRVRGNVLGPAGWEHRLPPYRVGRRQIQRHERIVEWDRNFWQGRDVGRE